jgi:NDP-sugar pyrophosphorylase family protein
MKALILAAGEGTRLGELTRDRPKPMLPLGGRPVLEHLVALLRHYGVTDIAINLHYRPEAIVQYLGDGTRFGVSITYSFEERLLGSAGAARRLDWFLSERFLVLYGDVLTDMNLLKLMEQHGARRSLATIALYRVPDPERCGIVQLDDDDRVICFVEKPAAAIGNLANAGIYVLEPEVLRFIPSGLAFDFGHDLFPILLRMELAVYGYRADGYFLDIGSPERYTQAAADLRAGAFRQYCGELQS